MTLTSAESLRLRIQDQPQVADETFVSDGSGTVFPLRHRNVVSGTAYISYSGAWSATGATFNLTGWVEMASALPNLSAVRIRYAHSVFSDDEIDHILTDSGSIPAAALEVVKILMFDGLRRSRWKSSDGSEYDDTKAVDLLKTMYETLKEELKSAELETVSGAFVSWTVNQDD